MRIVFEHPLRRRARPLQRLHVPREPRYAHLRERPVLAVAEKVAGAAHFEILFGNFEAVGGAAHGRKPPSRFLVFGVGNEHTVGRRPAASDAPAQLMQLRQAETVGILDHHERRIRHVDADLDHHRRHQHLHVARRKRRHRRFLFLCGHLPVQQRDGNVPQRAAFEHFIIRHRVDGVAFLAFFHQRAHNIRLLPCRDLFADIGIHPLAQRRADRKGLDGLPSRRALVQDRHIHVAEQKHRQRARDGGGGHDEQMRMDALFRKRRPLLHAETVLLVGDDKPEIGKPHRVRQKRVRAHDDVGAAVRNRGKCRALLGSGQSADQKHHPRAVAEHMPQRLRVLLCQKRRRRHERALPPALHRRQHQRRRNGGLTAADIALDKAGHRLAALHIPHAVRDRALLRARERKRQHALKGGGRVRRQHPAADGAQLRAPAEQSQLEQIQLVENEPFSCLFERFPALGEMDVVQRKARGAQPKPRPLLLGNQLGLRRFVKFRQRRLHVPLGDVAGQSRRLRINGADIPALGGGLYLRCEHLKPAARAGHRAEEQKRLPRAQARRRIARVEQRDGEQAHPVACRNAVHHAALLHRALLQVADDLCPHAAGHARRRRRHGHLL